MNIKRKYMIAYKAILSVLIFWTGSFSPIFGQLGKPLKSIISIENQHLIAKVENPIRIVAQQAEPVSINQLNATFQKYDSEKVPLEIVEANGYFIIQPDTIGKVEINIRVGDTIETKILIVKPMEAIGRIGRYGANTEEKISLGEFKAQAGIRAMVECCGFDAQCRILGFQILRIGSMNQTERTVNKGARFEEHTRKLIMKAASGDIFIFRQIKYMCGSGESQRLDDMIFELE